MKVSDPIHANPRPSQGLTIVLILAFCAGLLPSWLAANDFETAILAFATYVAALTLLVKNPYRASLTIGSATAGIALAAFWLKWVLRSEPSIVLTRIPFDNDLAMRVSGAFFLAFMTTWSLSIRQSSSSTKRKNTARVHAGSSNKPLLWLPTASVALALMAGRLWIAETYSIGVPGEVPLPTPFPAGTMGALYYLTTYGPLVAATILAIDDRPAVRFMAAYPILALYASLGTTLGYRSYGVIAAIVAIYALLRSGARAHSGTERTAMRLFAIPAILFGALVATSTALGARQSAVSDQASDGSALSFIVKRIGGLDYLSPVVYRVEDTGSTWSSLDPETWNHFMRVVVYGFPSDAVTGLSSTLPGYLFGGSGYLLVIGGGLLAGYFAGRIDTRFARDDTRNWEVLAHLGFVVAWTSLLLEGTLATSIAIAGSFASLGLVSRFFESGGRATAPELHPQTRGNRT